MDPTSSSALPRDPSPMRRRLIANPVVGQQQDVRESMTYFKTELAQSLDAQRLNHLKANVLNAIKGQGKELQSDLFLQSLSQLLGVAEKALIIEFLFEYFIVHFGRECDYTDEIVQNFLQRLRKSFNLDEAVEELDDWVKSAAKVIGAYVSQNGLSFWRAQLAFDIFSEIVKPLNFNETLSEIQKKLKLLHYVKEFSKDSIAPLLMRVLTTEVAEISEIKHYEVQQIAWNLESASLRFSRVLDGVIKVFGSVKFITPDLSKEVLINSLLKAFLNSKKKSSFDLFRLFKLLADFFPEEASSSIIKKHQREICTILRQEPPADKKSFGCYWESKSNADWRSAMTAMGVIFRSLPNLGEEKKIGHTVLALLLGQCEAKRQDLRFGEHELALAILKDVLMEWTPLEASELLILDYLYLNFIASLEEHERLSEEQVEVLKCQVINHFKISKTWLPSAAAYAQAYITRVMTKEPTEACEKSNRCIAFLVGLLDENAEAKCSTIRQICYQVVLGIVNQCLQIDKESAGLSERLLILLKENFKRTLQSPLQPKPREAEYLEKILRPQFFNWMQMFDLLTFLIEKVSLPQAFLDKIIQGLFNQIVHLKSNYFDCQAAAFLYMRARESGQTLLHPLVVFDSLAICDSGAPNDADINRFLKTFQASQWLESVGQVCRFIKNNDGESSAPQRIRLKVLRAINQQLQQVMSALSFAQVKQLVRSLECLKISGFYVNAARLEFAATLLYFYHYFKDSPEIPRRDFVDLTNLWLDIFSISLGSFEVIAVNIVKHLDHLAIPFFDIEDFLTTIFDLTKLDTLQFSEIGWGFKAKKISSTISFVKAALGLFSHRPNTIEWCLSCLLSEANFHPVLDYEDLLSILQLFARYQSSAMISPVFVMNNIQKLESLAIKSFRFSTNFDSIDLANFTNEMKAVRPLYSLLKAYAKRWEINLTRCKLYYLKNWIGASKDSIKRLRDLCNKSKRTSRLQVHLLRIATSKKSQEYGLQLLRLTDVYYREIPKLLRKAEKDHFLGSKEELAKLRDLEESAGRMVSVSHQHMQEIKARIQENVQPGAQSPEANGAKLLKGTPSVGHL